MMSFAMSNSTFVNVLIVAVLSCLIRSVVTLKCYQCETSTNKNCTYFFDLYLSVKPQECVDNGSLSLNGFSLSCLKILTTNYYGKIVNHQVVRKCIWKHENQNPCAIPTTLRPYSGPRTAHQTCTVCSDKDGCNGGSSLTNFTELVVLGAVGALMSTVALYVQ
ncbi:uncharacterized protein LOC119076607 [Bradysia coprophila]|uniref:uncharacterized protein LOC119076607 n=1 Tax=Bradysia coprophila TaxID=38358 RepID=UPI00187D971A|nr:uncharacterized protein LOC119076607 [Bradysia coprophila]